MPFRRSSSLERERFDVTPGRRLGASQRDYNVEAGEVMMIGGGRVAALAVVAALVGTPIEAQQFKRGLSGTIVSKSVLVPSGGSATVYTTPPTGHFILTQACLYCGGGGLVGSTFGQILTDITCTTYEPGIALPEGETLTCVHTACGGEAPCMITGILSSR
jgi:hypothetical protein